MLRDFLVSEYVMSANGAANPNVRAALPVIIFYRWSSRNPDVNFTSECRVQPNPKKNLPKKKVKSQPRHPRVIQRMVPKPHALLNVLRAIVLIHVRPRTTTRPPLPSPPLAPSNGPNGIAAPSSKSLVPAA